MTIWCYPLRVGSSGILPLTYTGMSLKNLEMIINIRTKKSQFKRQLQIMFGDWFFSVIKFTVCFLKSFNWSWEGGHTPIR